MYHNLDMIDFREPYHRGGIHMLRQTGMCRPNGLLFQQKSLNKGTILVKKSLEEGPISQKSRKNGKISHFEVEKPLEMCPDLRKFRKKSFKSAAF